MADKEKLPYLCPQHPDAKIRHEWDESHYVLNGLPAGRGVKSNQCWTCSVCGRVLSPPVKARK